jgi:hypothetical protein
LWIRSWGLSASTQQNQLSHSLRSLQKTHANLPSSLQA